MNRYVSTAGLFYVKVLSDTDNIDHVHLFNKEGVKKTNKEVQNTLFLHKINVSIMHTVCHHVRKPVNL